MVGTVIRTAASEAGGAAGGPVVLVVDDEFLGRVHLVDELLDHGFEVLEAASADAALCTMVEDRVDVVVTDRRMPGRLDGDGLAREIARKFPQVPVVMMSAEWPSPEETAAIAEFFPKPIDVGAVRRLLSHLVRTAARCGPRIGGAPELRPAS